MRSYFLFLFLCFIGTFAEDASTLKCDGIPSLPNRERYSIDKLAHCNNEKILKGSQRFDLDLCSAGQEEIDRLFRNKEEILNVAIYCEHNFNITEIVMTRFVKVSLPGFNVKNTTLEKIIISSQNNMLLELPYVDIQNNSNLSVIEFGKLSKIERGGFSVYQHWNLKNVSLSFMEGASKDMYDYTFFGNRVLDTNFMKSYWGDKPWDGFRQTERECEMSDVAEDLSNLKDCENIVGLLHRNSVSLRSLNVSEIKLGYARDGCLRFQYTEIQSISFLVNTSFPNCKGYALPHRITFNEFLCDYMDFVDNYKGDKSSFKIYGNCDRCQIEPRQSNFDQLQGCEKLVVGDLSFSKNITQPSKPFSLQRIDGCFKIEDTDLRTVNFLVGTRPNDQCNNTISGNRFLCDVQELIDNFPGDSSLVVKDNCNSECLTHGQPLNDLSKLVHCEDLVVGHLSFTRNVVATSRPKLLRKIEGCFHVEKTDLRTISFLKSTETFNDCTNRIVNNALLCDIFDLIDNYPGDMSKLIVEDNCHKCNTFNRLQSDFDKLSQCETILYGDLNFEKIVEPMPRWIHLNRIHGCFNIIGTDLTTVNFLIGTRTRSDCVNVIRDNKYLCDVDRVLNDIQIGTFIVAENNCDKVCYNPMELSNKNCEILYTDSAVPLNYTKNRPNLRKVHGPIKITSLKSDTVDPAILPAYEYDHLVFRNNEFLCDEEAVRKLIPQGKKVTFKHNCWKRCSFPQIVRDKNCIVFEGILDFRLFKDVELFERIVQKIEGVEGQIKIIGTNVRKLDFKNLAYVRNDKYSGPSIYIEKNKYLETVFLGNLTKVTSLEEAKIYIKNNGKFKFKGVDWRRIQNQTGTRLRKSLIVDVRKTKAVIEKCSRDDGFLKIKPTNGFLYYSLVALLIILVIATLIILFFIGKLCASIDD